MDKDEEFLFNPYTMSVCPLCGNETVEYRENPNKEDIHDELWFCTTCNKLVGKSINC